jgi:hypothetical protein
VFRITYNQSYFSIDISTRNALFQIDIADNIDSYHKCYQI